MRQDIDQRQQEHEFTQHRDRDRANGVADGYKRHLAGDLDSEDKEHRAVDTQRLRREGYKLGVGREYLGKDGGEEHYAAPQQEGIRQADRQQQAEGLAHPVGVAGAVIVARYRLRPLSDALERQHGELHYAREDSHCADRDIPAVFEQRRIEADRDNALARLHYEC